MELARTAGWLMAPATRFDGGVAMPGELDRLRDLASSLAAAAAAGGQQDVADEALRLAGRLGEGRMHLAVLGEFKRGKSTLVNALVGRRILPTGVIPVTTVATLLAYGEPSVTVRLSDGSERLLGAEEDLADYVSEARNPANARGVAEVEVRLRSPLLASGLVLVDTPGIGSIHRHNDEVAETMITQADGAVLVLSADSPLSGDERDLLARLAERAAPTYYVLNRVDHLGADELDQVRRFVEQGIAAALGHKERLWCVAALPGLVAKEAGREPGSRAGELAAFEAELARFVAEDLLGVRLATARRQLGRMTRELLDGLDLLAGALALEGSILAERVERFRRSALQERQRLADERVLLSRDVAVLSGRLGDDLASFARQAPARFADELEAVAERSPRRGLEETLRQVVSQAVEESFEAFRRQEADLVEEAWHALAEARRKGVQARVNVLRRLAAELFDIQLPTVAIPEVSEERERFFYLFVRVGGQIEDLARIGGWFLPTRTLRRRLAERAKVHLGEEMDKHAGRARWDLVQRLDAAHRRFEAALAAELERTVDMVLRAAERAEDLGRRAEHDRAGMLVADQAAREVARSVLAACATPQVPGSPVSGASPGC